MRVQRFLLMMTAIALFMASAVNAAVISVNLEYGSSTAPITRTEQAGMGPTTTTEGYTPDAFVTNWNNLEPQGTWLESMVLDDSGTPVGGGFDASTTGWKGSWNTNNQYGNRTILGDFAGQGGTLTISNIPYAKYDLVVIGQIWDEVSFNYSIDGGVTNQTIFNTPRIGPNDVNDTFLFTEGYQYTVFSDLTDANLTLNHGPLNAFQIVEIPPPTANSIADAGWELTTTWDTSVVPDSTYGVVIDGNDVTVSAADASADRMVIEGVGSVHVTNNRTLAVTGQIAIDEGSLTVDSGSTATMGSLAIEAAGSATLPGSLTVDNLNLAGSLDLNGGDLTVNGVATLGTDLDMTSAAFGNLIATTGSIFVNSGTLTVDHAINAQGLHIGAAGAVNLNGNNVSVQDVSVSTVALDMTGATIAATNSVEVTDGGTLTIDNAVSTANLRLADGGTVVNGASGSLTVTENVYLKAGSTDATITGSANLTVQGGPETNVPYYSTISGTSNTFSGKTEIQHNGNLIVDDEAALGESWIEFRADRGWEAHAQILSQGTWDLRVGRDTVTAGGGVRSVNWEADGGGFAAKGGPLTINLARGDGQALPLDWGNGDQGFRGRRLQMGNPQADDVVTLTSDIDLFGDRTFNQWDNRDSLNDMVVLSGVIADGDANPRAFTKEGDGVLWLSNTNTYTGRTRIRNGGPGGPQSVIRAVRASDDGYSLDVNSMVEFGNGVLEANGTFARDIVSPGTNGPGVSWDGNGGFAAWSSTPGTGLTVTLNGGVSIDWGDDLYGFRNRELYVGSQTANGVTTMTNDIDGGAAERRIYAENNPNSDLDAFVFGGDLTNIARFDVRGYNQGGGNWDTEHGIVAIGSSVTTSEWLRVTDHGYLRVDGTATVGGELMVEGQSKLGGAGSISVGSQVRVNGDSTITPGASVGQLDITGNLLMNDGATYEWEIGAAGSDLVTVDGDLTFVNNLNLTMIDLGGSTHTSGDIALFTYTGVDPTLPNLAYDASGMGSGWDTSALGLSLSSNTVWLTGLSASGPTELTWTGGGADNLWSNSANWDGTVAASLPMIIDLAGATVEVKSDFIAGGTGPAGSLSIGETAASTISVDPAVTLEVAGSVTVDAEGQYVAKVEGSTSGKIKSTAGTMTLDSVESLRVDWVENGASSMFGGVYTVAEYTGADLSLSGEFSNAGSNIGGAYVEAVDYTGGTVDVTLYQQKVGDVDLDGDVEFSDLSNLLDNWGIGTSWAEGDTDFSGDVVFADLSNLLDNWGTPLASGAGAQIGVVPEPGTLLMLIAGMAGLLIYRKRR